MRLSEADLVSIGKALADPQRREILEDAARTGELCCSSILERHRLAQATVSHHLKELANAGLLERRKDGQFAYYRFVPQVLQAYLDELEARLLPVRRRRKPG